MSASPATKLLGEARDLQRKAEASPSAVSFEMAALCYLRAAAAYRRESAACGGNGDHERAIDKLDAAELAMRSAAVALEQGANEDAACSFRASEKMKTRRADA